MMTKKTEDVAGSSWQIKKLLLVHGVILGLLGSWFLYFSHPFWEMIDYHFYLFVNGFIEKSLFWQTFWAVSNHNLTDWLHDVVMLSFFGLYLAKKTDKPFSKKVFELVFFCLLVGLTIVIINRWLCLDVLHIQRKSPSLVYQFAINLAHKLPWIKVKGYSMTSYPGDHGTTAILFTMCVFHLMGWRAGILAFLYNIYWQLPRLVTGCHWFTDIIMGSLVISLFVMSWAIYTPLKEWSTTLVSDLFRKRREKRVINS